MEMDRVARQKLHGLVFDIISAVNERKNIDDKDKEFSTRQVRRLEEEILKDEPNAQVISETLDDLKKSFPWLTDKVGKVRNFPRVRDILKSITPKKKGWFGK